jgi:hypothetical protein
MNLAILSFFRNSGANGQARRFLRQAVELRNAWPGNTRLIAVHGDSVDNTKEELTLGKTFFKLNMDLVEANHGGPTFGSIESEARFKALSFIANVGLDQIDLTDDIVFYVESDLIWTSETVINLAEKIKQGVDVVAPLIFAGENFYDVFCYRKNGARFAPFYPYHSELSHNGHLTEVDSVGSAFVMKAIVGRQCRILNDNVLLGFFENARSKGFHVYVDPHQKVVHP